MLDALTQIGAHRISYLSDSHSVDPLAFGFYIRGEKESCDAYSRDAKQQLYAGLVLIHSKLQMQHLCGIYMDVDTIENLERPAYLQLKRDLINGYFKRVFVLDESALFGSKTAEEDLRKVYELIGGFELIVCHEGECVNKRLPWIFEESTNIED